MRRLEYPIALALLIAPLSAQGAHPTPQPAPEAISAATPAQSQDQAKDKETDVQRLTKEIKEVADSVRSQMKEITKGAASQKQKLEARINKIKEEADEARAGDSQETLRSLTQQQRQLESEVHSRVNEAHAKAQETLKSTSFQCDKLSAKLRGLGEAKAADDALGEYTRAREESQRLLQEVIGKPGADPRVASTRGVNGAAPAPAIAGGRVLVGRAQGGGGAGAVLLPGAPVPVARARAGVLEETETEEVPAAPAQAEAHAVKAMLEIARAQQQGEVLNEKARVEAQLLRARAVQQAGEAANGDAKARFEEVLTRVRAQGAVAPERAAAVEVAPDRAEIGRLRGEIKGLRSEIEGLRDLLKSLLKEKEKEDGKKDKAPAEARNDPPSTPEPLPAAYGIVR